MFSCSFTNSSLFRSIWSNKHYNLWHLVKNGFVLVEIRKGMYGLPQSGILANEKLVAILAKAGYIQSTSEKSFSAICRHDYTLVSETHTM